MKRLFCPVDLSSAETVIYHVPDGPSFMLPTEGIKEYIDLELEQGDICDTSDIDGIVHFFPKGNA